MIFKKGDFVYLRFQGCAGVVLGAANCNGEEICFLLIVRNFGKSKVFKAGEEYMTFAQNLSLFDFGKKEND